MILDHGPGELTAGAEGPEPELSNVDLQQPFSGGHDCGECRKVIHGYTHGRCKVSHMNSSTHHAPTDSKAGGALILQTTTVPEAIRSTEHRPIPAEEFHGGASSEVNQGTGGEFLVPSQGIGGYPLPSGDHTAISNHPNDSDYILRFMRKSDGSNMFVAERRVYVWFLLSSQFGEATH